MDSVVVRAPAKTNLVLRCGPRRADGFHDLATVFCSLDLYDTVTVRRAPPGSGPVIRVTGIRRGGVPEDSRNLAVRAVQLLAARRGVPADVAIEVDKRIPVAGGMAGGSTDAAAALVALNALWSGSLSGTGTPSSAASRTGSGTGSRDELFEVAAALGSDVPFCLTGGAALGLGRGEVLEPVPVGVLHGVVLPATGGLSTPAVFARTDERRADTPVPPVSASRALPDALRSALRAGDAAGVAPHLVNDLQDAALDLRPDLAATLERGRAAGALAALVSGSGPTCVLLCGDADHAAAVAGVLGEGIVVRGPVEAPRPEVG